MMKLLSSLYESSLLLIVAERCVPIYHSPISPLPLLVRHSWRSDQEPLPQVLFVRSSPTPRSLESSGCQPLRLACPALTRSPRSALNLRPADFAALLFRFLPQEILPPNPTQRQDFLWLPSQKAPLALGSRAPPVASRMGWRVGFTHGMAPHRLLQQAC